MCLHYFQRMKYNNPDNKNAGLIRESEAFTNFDPLLVRDQLLLVLCYMKAALG